MFAQKESLQEFCTSHMLGLSLLSKLLQNTPDNEQYDPLFSQGLFAEWPLENINQDIVRGLEIISEFSQEYAPEKVVELKDDYHALLIGPPPLAMPWQSVWTGKEGLLFDEDTSEVRDWYYRYSLEIELKDNEPDDHIGLELAFVVHLMALSVATAEFDPEKAQEILFDIQRFMKKHTLVWCDKFWEAMEQNAETQFFKGLGRLGKGSLRQLGDDLEEYLPSG